jgi:peroxiredoxin (alkyl hydroperoxide reductase subunit C)
MSLIGKEVQAFTAQAYWQGKFVKVTEQDLKGNWSVVFFYPADFTFVCPTELADLQDVYASDFKNLGVNVYSVSTDTHFVHKAWADATDTIRNIEYMMIGDPNHQLARQFNVLIESEGLADRGTFVIDPDGRVQIIEINPGGVGRDARELLRKVKAAKYTREHPGEVCPAKWTEGAATLAPSLDLIGKL